jgi:hypothetical protein
VAWAATVRSGALFDKGEQLSRIASATSIELIDPRIIRME